MKMKFRIKGLDCANCAAELERAINKIDGIENAVINFMTQKMEFECDESNKDKIMEKVRKVIRKEEPDVTIEEA